MNRAEDLQSPRLYAHRGETTVPSMARETQPGEPRTEAEREQYEERIAICMESGASEAQAIETATAGILKERARRAG